MVLEWIIIVSLLVIGAILIVAEIILIPGTTVVGIFGLAVTAGGIAIAYYEMGPQVGTMVLGGTIIMDVAILIRSFQSGAWKRWALKSKNPAKVNVVPKKELRVGMEGVCVSDLKPVGNAEFSGKRYSVRSEGPFVDSGRKVKIILLYPDRIIVEAVEEKREE
ncbi:hypothetical protein FUAX_34060 [Fulvitalea axinellae]|uniref:NfeD-like C-terminal domain-containing protein n=1 Tax=Fulvitalea axinellae TaxID=1182444 RepID=A0AAU9CWV9_9BACT|nr:hypothetical protein FUAX_34060 [Fulvitalea axinellae]